MKAVPIVFPALNLMPSDIDIITTRLSAVEGQSRRQAESLDEAVGLLKRIHTSISGDPAMGIIGMIESNRLLGEHLNRHEVRLEAVEEKMKEEKWVGRIGAGVIGSVSTAAFIWLKSFIFPGQGQ